MIDITFIRKFTIKRFLDGKTSIETIYFNIDTLQTVPASEIRGHEVEELEIVCADICI